MLFFSVRPSKRIEVEENFRLNLENLLALQMFVSNHLGTPPSIKEKGLTFQEERVGTMDFIWKSPVPAGPSSRGKVIECNPT